jgi:hypothetical protein
MKRGAKKSKKLKEEVEGKLTKENKQDIEDFLRKQARIVIEVYELEKLKLK